MYNLVLKQLQSDLCYRIWETVSCAVSDNNFVSHEITVLDVLDPYFSECCRILKDLKQSSIQFGEIERLLHQDDSLEKLELNLNILHQGVESHNGKTPSSFPKWIEKAARFIQTYWNLHCHGDVLRTLLSPNNTIFSLYDQFTVGGVSIEEVQIAVENSDQLKLLFVYSTSDNNSVVSPTDLESTIRDREEECRKFRNLQTLLLNLCHHVAIYDQVHVEGKP